LLLLPALLWNLALTDLLPAAFSPSEFWRDVPQVLASAENTLRILIFSLPFLMPLQIVTKQEQNGMLIFIVGSLTYFASWLALIAAPSSPWATSAIGFLAPAYTPVIWLAGLALLGRRLFWGDFYRWWMYLVPALLFIIAHISHASLIYVRNY
jgi:hypothetical protein